MAAALTIVIHTIIKAGMARLRDALTAAAPSAAFVTPRLPPSPAAAGCPGRRGRVARAADRLGSHLSCNLRQGTRELIDASHHLP